jgi:hypothetical protein
MENILLNENLVVVKRGVDERIQYGLPPEIQNPIDEEDEWGLS